MSIMSHAKGFPDPDWREIAKMTPIQFEAYCDQLQAITSKIIYDGDLETAAELKAAGWKPEPLHLDSLMMSWRWRRPALPGRKTGRLFLSPTQALNALRKERA